MSQLSEGADTASLRANARALATQADRIAASTDRADRVVESLRGAWQGNDAEDWHRRWSRARAEMRDCADAVEAMGRALTQQVADQERTSAVGPTEGAATAGPHATRQDPPVLPDTNDRRDGSWFCQVFGWGCPDPEGFELRGDPGVEGVDLPEGADPTDPSTRALMATPSGREMLQWLHDNGIEIVVDPNQQGAIYDPGRNAMVLGDQADPGTIMHEANHAQYDAEDRTTDIQAVPRSDYVSGMIDEEASGVETEFRWAAEARALGATVPISDEEQRWVAAHDQTSAAALAGGASPEEADRAGAQAAHQEALRFFSDGTYVTSNTHQTYAEYYGASWDSVH